MGPAGLADAEQWLPPLPNGLVPVAVGMPRDAGPSGTPSTGLRMRVLNPGASRQPWCPQGWVIRRREESVDSKQPVDLKQSVDPNAAADCACGTACNEAEGIVFRPGELVEVVLTPLQEHLDQSS